MLGKKVAFLPIVWCGARLSTRSLNYGTLCEIYRICRMGTGISGRSTSCRAGRLCDCPEPQPATRNRRSSKAREDTTVDQSPAQLAQLPNWH